MSFSHKQDDSPALKTITSSTASISFYKCHFGTLVSLGHGFALSFVPPSILGTLMYQTIQVCKTPKHNFSATNSTIADETVSLLQLSSNLSTQNQSEFIPVLMLKPFSSSCLNDKIFKGTEKALNEYFLWSFEGL